MMSFSQGHTGDDSIRMDPATFNSLYVHLVVLLTYLWCFYRQTVLNALDAIINIHSIFFLGLFPCLLYIQ